MEVVKFRQELPCHLVNWDYSEKGKALVPFPLMPLAG